MKTETNNIQLNREIKILLLEVLRKGFANTSEAGAISDYFSVLNPFERMRRNHNIKNEVL